MRLFLFGCIAGGCAYDIYCGGMSKLFVVVHTEGFGGFLFFVLANDYNSVGIGDAVIISSIQVSNVHKPDEALPSVVCGAMDKTGKVLLEGTIQAGSSAGSVK